MSTSDNDCDDDEPTMLEIALGRTWTRDDARRLLHRMDQEVEALGEEAESLYNQHFCDVVADPEPEYRSAFERAVYQDLAYLRSNGAYPEQGYEVDDETMADHVLSWFEKYLDPGSWMTQPDDHDSDDHVDDEYVDDAMSFQDEDEGHVDDDDDDDEIMMSRFKLRYCGVGVIDADEEICVVCQDGLYRENGTIATIACRHEFHPQCIARWLRQSASCPLCKAQVY